MIAGETLCPRGAGRMRPGLLGFSPGIIPIAFRLFSVQPRNALARIRAHLSMRPLVDSIGLVDPLERLAATLERLDDAMTQARRRVRSSGGSGVYSDPDTLAIARLEATASKLVEDYHAQRRTHAADVTTLDRQAAIAELRAVLAVWEDPTVSDAQWLASRGVRASAPTVVRRKRTP